MTVEQIAEVRAKYVVDTSLSSVPVGYQQSEVGLIPSEWEVLTINDVAEFSGGSQPPKNTFSSAPKAGYIRLIQIRDYKTSDYETFIPEHLARKKCSATDIMIGRYGPPIFQILRGIEGAYNVALIKASPKKNITRDYLFYCLKSEKLFELMDMLSQRSSGQTGVELPALKAYPIPLPPIHEQTAIANALSDVDALIQELEKLIAKKQAIKTATMQQLLTGRTRLPQFAHHPDGRKKGYKPSELGEIPEDWEAYGFGLLFQSTVTKKSVKQNSLVTFVGMQDVTEQAQLVCQHFVSIEKVKSGFTYFERGDVLVAKITPCFENGKGCHTETLQTEIGFGSTEFHVLRTTDNADSKFVYYWTTRDNFRRALESEMVGSAGHRRVPLAAISNYQIPVPSKVEQTAIAKILSDMDGEIQSLEQRFNKTRQIKQGMMQELLTGKTRLVKPAGAA
ncbi:restriction endonuclease subunit S [Vibrio cholerae]|nr:restriction endonuclease subunit S [Vibrio cholerae]